MSGDTYDYIIVGAGTAGCLLANRLSADPSARVLLLEAGGKDNYHWIHIPVGYLYLMGNPRADWCFKTAAEPGLNGRSLAYPRGKVLGGCSSINGMIYMRGQARDYDLWRQMGNPGWGWDDVLPYFKKHQDQWALEPDAFEPGAFDKSMPAAASGASSSRASTGRSSTPSATPPPRPASPRSTTSIAATTRAAATSTSISGPACAGTPPRASCVRCSAGAICKVETHAQVERLVLEGKRATRARRAPERPDPHASRRRARSILSAGAIGSPQILQLSGIGPGRAAQQVRHHRRARDGGRRREPAGPPADPLRLQGAGREHHERALPEPHAARRLRAGIRVTQARADDHGAVPARRLRAAPIRAATRPTCSITSSR